MRKTLGETSLAKRRVKCVDTVWPPAINWQWSAAPAAPVISGPFLLWAQFSYWTFVSVVDGFLTVVNTSRPPLHIMMLITSGYSAGMAVCLYGRISRSRQ